MERVRPNPALYDDILERILDRGVILDGLSSLAAVSSRLGRSIHATAYCPLADNKETPTVVLTPPRKRDREEP